MALTRRQMAICAILGAILWFVAAKLCAYLGPKGVYEGSARALLYALVIPGTVPFVFLIKKLAGLAKAQLALGLSFATMTAMFLDGAALAWFPGLYGGSETLTAGAGAVILWGAAVAIALGFIFGRE